MSEVDILLKLFDTLKDSSKESQQLLQALLTNQNNIGNYIKNLPMEDLRQALKEHSNHSEDKIGTCTDTVVTKSNYIIEEIKKIRNRIKIIVLVIGVTFTLFSAASLFGIISYKIAEKKDENKRQEYTIYDDLLKESQSRSEHEKLKDEIISIIKKEFKLNKDSENKKIKESKEGF